MRVAMFGLFLNLLLSSFKIAAGILGRSRAVVADGVHSLSDMATDGIAVFAASYTTDPADREHPYGHGRLDVLISLSIGILMLLAGLALLVSSINDLLRAEARPPPGMIALVAAMVSLLSKEILFRWTLRRADQLKAAALRANAMHQRSDALSSIPVIIAVIIARSFPALQFLDSVGGMVVSLFILKMSWDINRRAVRVLSDTAAPQENLEKIRFLIGDVTEVREVHRIRSRFLGDGWSIDLHVLVSSEMSVRDSHAIASKVKQLLLDKGPDIVDVVVHIEPIEEKSEEGIEL